MDYERALKVVEDYLALIEEYDRNYENSRRAGSRTFLRESKEAADAASSELQTRLPLIVSIGAEFYPNFAKAATVGGAISRFYDVKNSVLMLRGSLRDAGERQEIIGTTGPRIAAADLHPDVWNAADRLWDGGHYRQAVESAATAVNDALRAKLNRLDVSGADLVSRAFTIKDPQEGEPRLRFLDIDPADRDTWVNAHDGAMHFGRGAMMAIRNIVSHSPEELEPQIALEQLAALSVLARWIDAASVVTSDE